MHAPANLCKCINRTWNSFINFNLVILRWCVFDIQTGLRERQLQMFVLAISKPILKTVGIHQHSNNVPWHQNAICEYLKAWERRGQLFYFFFSILFSDRASGDFFFFYLRADLQTNKNMKTAAFQDILKRHLTFLVFLSVQGK